MLTLHRIPRMLFWMLQMKYPRALFSYQMAFCKSANSLLAKHRNAFNSNQSMRTTFSCHIMITIIIPNERKPVFNLWWIWNKYDIPIILCMNSIMDIPNSNKISGEFGYFRMDPHYFRIFFLIPQPSKTVPVIPTRCLRRHVNPCRFSDEI